MRGRGRSLTPEAATVGPRLRLLRKQRGMTQSELARQIGIQQSDLSRMEKGEYRVSLDNLFRILAVFGMDVAEFFAGAAPAPEPERQPLSHEDMQALQLLRRLSPEARREVQEFIEFKARKERAAQRMGDSARRAEEKP
jgi:transcriptional regulator with XRE-family HTH domain